MNHQSYTSVKTSNRGLSGALAKVSVAAGLLAVPSTAGAAWETATIGGLDVRVYTPAAESPAGEGRALMVILHGCSQSADQIKTHGNLEAAADSMGVVMAVPNVPGGGVVAGCWNYYGAAHTRSGGHNGPVVAMTEAMRDDAAYGIDAAQMYIVGFSSGGGQALILGCVAPDLYAGVGAIAAPGLGSTINEIGNPTATGDSTANLCRQFAGGHSADLETQTGIVFNDANDFTVAQGYGLINTEMFANTMSDGVAAMQSEGFDMAGLPGATPTGMGTIYSDGIGARVVRLQSSGVGHNWPAGSGEAGAGGLTFVSSMGLNFSQYAAEFFAEHNVRTDGWEPGDDDGTGSDDDGDGGDDDDDDDGPGDASGAGEAGDDNGGGTDGDDSAGPGGGDDGGGDDGGGDGADGGADGVGPGDPGYTEPSGCQCNAVPAAPGWAMGWAMFGLLGLGFLRRR